MRAEWLPVLMQGSFGEIYVLDRKSLHIAAANPAACANLHCATDDLVATPFLSLMDVRFHGAFTSALEQLDRKETDLATVRTEHRRKDGQTYPLELRLLLSRSAESTDVIVIGNDLSGRQASLRMLAAIESRFSAITSNTPGLVYQFRRRADGSTEFPYVSEGCHPLLGISPEQLCDDASIFTRLILAEDRASYQFAMDASARDMKSWNWEGRIWVEEWKDIKWINLRSTPQMLDDGGIQWDGIMTNITQSKMEEAEVRKSREQLAELSAHIQTVKEQERTRIAREIHDDLGGNLTAIKMALSLLARRLPAEDATLQDKVSYVDSLVDRTIESVHRIAGDLRPSILDLGIAAAIDWQAQEFEKQLGIPCAFVSNKTEIDLHPDQAIALFRIFQEAVTNIGKHANATEVQVNLISSNRGIRLEIADNGRGIDATDALKPKSFGIRGMKERVAALGGELTVERGSAGGTVVSVRIPSNAP